MKKRKLWLLLGGIVLVLVLAVTPLMAGCAAPEEVKPPVEKPPVEKPPVEKPPVEKPPVEKPPEEVFELVYSTITANTVTNWFTDNWWMDEIEKRTNGRVLFTERYHSCQLFGGFDTLAGLGRGGCDVAAILGGFNPAEVDMLCGLGLPLLVDDAGVYCRAGTEMIRTDPRLIEEATRNNIHYLAKNLIGMWHLVTTEKPITEFEDLQGLTIWNLGPFAPLIAAWGGTPVLLEIPEVYEAAERGLIDGEIFVLADVYAFRVFEISKYFTEIGLGPFDGTWTPSVNLDTWNSFPPDIKKIFNETADEVTPYGFELQRKNDEDQVKVFHEAGMILSTLPPEDIQKVKALAPVMVDWWVNLKPEEAEARRGFVQDYLDIVDRTTVPAEWYYDPRPLFK